MSNTGTTSGRFSPLMKKLKEQSSRGGDEFDPTLTEDQTPMQPANTTAQPAKKRSPGKKNNPDFTQTTAYIRARTYDEATKRLIDEGRKRDYSDLVEDLISEWLAANN
jgi:hypothetical protein